MRTFFRGRRKRGNNEKQRETNKGNTTGTQAGKQGDRGKIAKIMGNTSSEVLRRIDQRNNLRRYSKNRETRQEEEKNKMGGEDINSPIIWTKEIPHWDCVRRKCGRDNKLWKKQETNKSY